MWGRARGGRVGQRARGSGGVECAKNNFLRFVCSFLKRTERAKFCSSFTHHCSSSKIVVLTIQAYNFII